MDNSKATAREPATADVGREALAIADRVASECEADIGHCSDDDAVGQERARGGMIEARRISKLILAALSRAAPSSGHAMAEGEREINCAVCGESVKHTSAGYCFSCIKGFKVPLTTTPPTTNDAIPAGMVEQAVALCERYGEVSAANEQEERDAGGEEQAAIQMGAALAAFNLAGMIRALSTPKPSPTPKGGLPGRGEVSSDTVAFVQDWLMNADYDPTQFDKDFAAAIDARVLSASLPDLARRFCTAPLPDDVCADLCATTQGPGRTGTNLLTVAQAERVLAHVLTPAEAIRDGGEGGEG